MHAVASRGRARRGTRAWMQHPATTRDQLLAALKASFGYDSFRPLQEEIVEATLGGRDVLALLPTGGGKSLCYQLPALLRQGPTLVISPLIALMKDQVDALEAAGIPATYLNSTLDEDEARLRLRGLYEGRYRLLYAAPERLFAGAFATRLEEWGVTAVAVDEAHCISEWGHDFRPEYRRLRELRQMLPGVPFLALTATATGRVREDICTQLQLSDPAVFVGSFNRPNLSYRVIDKEKPSRQVLDFVAARPDDSGIVYCQSRRSCESLAEHLRDHGVAAIPYHAGLADQVRSRNQEAFLRDDARVVCATIAFGMGINKPNVRFVVHHDLPRNIEGYYQETGRAGRDGLPAECLLLMRASDAARQIAFLDEIADPDQKRNAERLLRLMIDYAEGSGCRRRALLSYFGEEFPDTGCGSCDNCLEPKEQWDATTAAQKMLSTVLRARSFGSRDDAAFGLAHHAEVLVGSDTERIRRWGHSALSTHGIGKEHTRAEWLAIGRALVRQGLLTASPGEYPTVEVSEDGLDVLRTRTPVLLPKLPARSAKMARVAAPTLSRRGSGSAGDIPCDETLFARLKALRRRLADAVGKPAYIIFGDVTLREMARDVPRSSAALGRVTGVGATKLEKYGDLFLAEIRDHMGDEP